MKPVNLVNFKYTKKKQIMETNWTQAFQPLFQQYGIAPRLGIAAEEDATKPEKVEKKIMAAVPREFWNECGMAISFLGRELCRPTNPKCEICPMNTICRYYQSSKH